MDLKMYQGWKPREQTKEAEKLMFILGKTKLRGGVGRVEQLGRLGS